MISDFQRSNWGTLFVDLVPADVKIQFHTVAEKDIGNVAISSARFATEPVIGQPALLEVELANYSDREVDVRCRVDLSGLQCLLEAKLLPQTTQTKTQSLTFEQAGWKHGWAKLESNLDGLPADDERPLAVRVRPAVKVLLVTRQNQQEVPSSSFYLEQALNIALNVSTVQPAIIRINPLKSVVRSWPDSEVLVLVHPGALAKEMLQSIAGGLRRGKGLLYVTGELVDAANLEQLSAMLGGDFQPPVTLHPLASGTERKNLFVQRMQSRQGPFSVLGSASATPLQSVRFSGGLSTRATSEGLRDQVLAELSDTSALLYLTSVGAGQMAILNTDLGRSNWSMHPTFLPVISELTQTLIAGRGQSNQAACGEPLVRMLPPTVSDSSSLVAATIEGAAPADSRYGDWQWSAGQCAVVWSWPEPTGAGIYALKDQSEAVAMVATSAPAAEADLQTLDETILTERITDDRVVGFTSTKKQDEKSDETWNWLIVTCLVGLIAEIAALRFSKM